MEKLNHELLASFIPTNPDLKKIYMKHKKLNKEVENLEKFTAYSSSARLRQKELKKQKLYTVEKMIEIIKSYQGVKTQLA